jgi:DNA-directed RNA polymerase subunit alpha
MFKGFQKPKRLVANTDTLTERYGMFTAQPFQRQQLAARAAELH